MTQAPEAAVAFKAKFSQIDVLIGGTTLTMDLGFEPSGVGVFDVTGPARLTRGSTNPPLDVTFPMVGQLRFNALEPITPTELTLSLHSEFPDHRLGLSLTVELTARSESAPWQLENLTFAGEYTYLMGEPVTVSDARFEVSPLLGD